MDDADRALELAKVNYESAMSFASGVVQAGLLLNGGALIAIPAFAAMFDVDPRAALWPLGLTGAMFVLGLIAAWLLGGVGYLGATAAEESSYHRWEQALAEKVQNAALTKAAKDKADAKEALGQNWRRVGFALGAASYLLFLIGAGVGGWTLMNHAAAPSTATVAPSNAAKEVKAK